MTEKSGTIRPKYTHLVTKGIVPVFLGSSFAFIAPIVKATELYGLDGTTAKSVTKYH
ncbi:MAG: hypothetical protein PHS04_09890 [Tissierellia bacterium]|nr:hypothetical protein [Tissierellia bacterium]